MNDEGKVKAIHYIEKKLATKMSGLSHFGQKKKREAIRRLSSGVTPRGRSRPASRGSEQAWPPRRRSREEVGDFPPGRSGRETKRTRSSVVSSGDSDSSGTNLFASRRIVQGDDGHNLVISKSRLGDSDSDVSRSSLSQSPSAATGGIFSRMQGGQFGGQDEAGAYSDDGIIKPATSASRNIFGGRAVASDSQAMNPFASRVAESKVTTKRTSAPQVASQVPSTTFKFTVPGTTAGPNSAPSSSYPPVFGGASSFGTRTDEGQPKGFSNFAFTVKQTGEGSGRESKVVDRSQKTGTDTKPASSMSSFTFRTPTTPDSVGPPSGTDSAGIFGMKSDPHKSDPSSHKFTFAKPKSDGFGGFKPTSPIKRPTGQTAFGAFKPTSPIKRSSSDQAAVESYTKRPITKWTDPFSETTEKDLSDLETFGVDTSRPPEPKPKKPLIKKGSLFGRAISDASMGRDPHDRRSDRTRREEDRDRDGRRQRDIDRDRDERRRGDGREREEIRRRRDEEDENKSLSRVSINRSGPSSTRRYTSAEEIKHLRSIVIQNVPDVANSRSFLKQLFSEFGPVVKVNSMPSKATAVVHFEDHDSARAAKKCVRVLKPGTKPVSIFWSQTESSRPSSRGADKSEKDGKEKKASISSRPLAPFNRTQQTASSSNNKPVARYSGPVSSRKKQVAMTVDEKRDILEARDKLIRQGSGNKKQSDLATARALKGTCPDMCPEKERYLRVVQRRISMYEQLTAQDQVHHPFAVKEYSRSSADQEEPLPHELRPVSVLMMTMNYLMNNIMNRGEEEARWADWFDFLWNRTRAIRKDITQQHLWDTTAVELMEKCSRFHIFCAHRLCDQDRAVFDPKINNENLTKCLQSLKQFYHDLADEDIFCPSEAEFRAYDVLLNLNEGDILRQVQQYRPEVRSSEDVKFAVKAFSAVNSNNYVKFFKLVRSASYMNACSMHRYFTQMRSQAILIMNKAYSGPKTTQYPLDDIIRLLAFEGVEEATEFCEAHGLLVSDGSVHFHRSSFSQPESAIVAFRSVSIIESKNRNTIGEIVNGAPLPPNHIHEPSSSFTDAGVYRGDITSSSTRTEDVLQKEEEEIVETTPISSSTDETITTDPEKIDPPRRPAHQYSNTAVKDVAKEMFIDVINDMAVELSQDFLQRSQFVKIGSFDLYNKILGESLLDLCTEVAMETYQGELRKEEEERLAEQRNLEQKRLAQQRMLEEQRLAEQRKMEHERLRQESINRVSAEVVESTIDEIVRQESQNVALTQYSEVQEQLKQECIARSSKVVSLNLLQETLQEECSQVYNEVVQAAIEQRDQKLAELEKCILMSRTARYLQKWRRLYTLRVRLKRSQMTFPAAPPNQSFIDQLRALWPSRTRQVPGRPESTSAVTLDTPFSVMAGQERVAKTILRRHYLTCLRKQKAWAPFDLPTMLSSSFLQSQHARRHDLNHQYWKLVMSLPDVSHDWTESFDWLQAKLKRGKLQDRFRDDTLNDSELIQTLSLYTAEVATQRGHHQCIPMSVCTKVTKGHVQDYELGCNQLLGTSAVLFVINEINLKESWQEPYQRLHSLLKAKPANPAIPVLITILGDQANHSNISAICEAGLKLRELQHCGLLSTYHVIGLEMDIEDPKASELLSEGIQWLASHHPHPPSLEEDILKGYIDTGLMKLFSLPLHEDARLRRKAGLSEQDVHYVVSLHNAVVQHLAAVASSRSLVNLSWPVVEFAITQRERELPQYNWNQTKVVTLLNNRINRLQLPDAPSLHDDCSWKEVCESLHNYVLDQLPGREVDKAPLISRVQWLLDRSRRSFQNTCYLTYDTPGCEPTARHIPWVNIIEACITFMVSTINAEDQEYSDDDPVIVYYYEQEFDSLTSPEEWKHARNTTRENTYTQPDSLSKSLLETVHQRQAQLSETHSSDNQSHTGAVSKVKLEYESPSVVAAKDTAEYLKAMLHAEKEETQRYEKLLNSLLNDPPQTNQGTSNDTLDTDAPLTVHIPQQPEERSRTYSSGDVIMRDGGGMTDAAQGQEETLSDRLEKLKQRIALERQADELEELRLAQLLGL